MYFQGKTVIVTGAAKGIGRGIALLYAEKGANVVAADIDEAAGARTAAEIREKGGEALKVQTDVREEADIIRLMETANRTYGHIDILINNAGISVFRPFFELSPEEWDDIINTNLRSVFLCSQGHHVRAGF